eukprot:10701494-Alexandrium_andersonii.AAC.1
MQLVGHEALDGRGLQDGELAASAAAPEAPGAGGQEARANVLRHCARRAPELGGERVIGDPVANPERGLALGPLGPGLAHGC